MISSVLFRRCVLDRWDSIPGFAWPRTMTFICASPGNIPSAATLRWSPIPDAPDKYIAQFRVDAGHDSTSTKKPGALYSQRRSPPVRVSRWTSHLAQAVRPPAGVGAGTFLPEPAGTSASAQLLLLLNHYPQGLMMLLLLRIMPDLSKRKSPLCHQPGLKKRHCYAEVCWFDHRSHLAGADRLSYPLKITGTRKRP